jgi:flavin reductase (NADH)/flavin reductase
MTISPELFKQGMRRLTASVCVITTKDKNGVRHGITATAVCSVTAEPPTLLCCMNRSNTSYEAFRDAGRFAVNVLGTDHKEIAGRFASKLDSEARFEGAEWIEAETGSPILVAAAVGFDCRTVQLVEAGSHTIFIGEIADIVLSEAAGGCLLYGDGAYGAFSAH